jgi:uncharacterized phiE125 gp8 family phage protein
MRLIIPPTTEPITLAEAKLHLRVDNDLAGPPPAHTDDPLITALITAAREQAEAFTRRAFVTQTWEIYLDRWPQKRFIELPFPPLQSVTGVFYTLSGDVEAEFADVVVNLPGRQIVLADNKSWPAGTLTGSNPIRVRFVVGYGDAAAVPASVKAAMLLTIGHLYANRESVIVGATVAELPQAVDALLRSPFQDLRF